jgi:hypothetical protein
VRGRYAHHPAHADERGVTWVPPAVPDPLPRQLLLGAAVAGGLYAVARSRRRARAGAGERAVRAPT